MSNIDLHIHTNASDGTLSPKDLINLAIKKNMKAIAITDHDTISGLKEALEYSKNKNIEVIPGVEISCEDNNLNIHNIHILGLFINYKNKKLNLLLEKLKQSRIKQKKEIIKKLNKLDFDITFDELKKEVGDSFGRPHIAKILVKKGIFSNTQNVFEELIDEGKRAYVKQKQASIKEAINTIKNSKGISILAHPAIYGLNNYKKIINRFINLGGQGLEVNYPYDKVYTLSTKLTSKLNLEFRKIVKNKNLLISGGTDFHGGYGRPIEIGDYGINKKELQKLKESITLIK